MIRKPHDVLATREARAQLPGLLKRFRQDGADAEPVIIGARRRPEAVVLSCERYLQLAGGRERVAAALDRQTREATASVEADEALKLANSELHAFASRAPHPATITPRVRAVLDPNVLIFALISPAGPPREIVTAWVQGHFELLASPTWLDELRSVLARPKVPPLSQRRNRSIHRRPARRRAHHRRPARTSRAVPGSRR